MTIAVTVKNEEGQDREIRIGQVDLASNGERYRTTDYTVTLKPGESQTLWLHGSRMLEVFQGDSVGPAQGAAEG